MLYIDPQRRDSIDVFQATLKRCLKIRELRHSVLRERVLSMFHLQDHPISVYMMVSLLNERKEKTANYSSVVRHVKFFNELGWLRVVDKNRREYLLVESPTHHIEGRDEEFFRSSS